MRSPLYEQILNKEGVKWKYLERLALADINDSRSLRSQARLVTPVNQELIAQYAQMKRQGLEPPALVVWKPAYGEKYIAVDGNQRRKALEDCKCKFHDAYLIESTDSEVIDRITWTWNNKANGLRNTEEECIQHALTFVRKYGYTQKRAAEEWGVSANKLRAVVAAEEVREALESQKVKVPDRVPETVLHDLQPLLKCGHDVLAESAKVVIDNGLAHKDTVEIVDKVLRSKTHEDKLEAVQKIKASEAIERRKAQTKGGTVRATREGPGEKVMRLTAEIVKVITDFPDLKKLLPSVGSDAYKDGRLDARIVVEAFIKAYGLGALPREAAS
jgi:hypothetical protein